MNVRRLIFPLLLAIATVAPASSVSAAPSMVIAGRPAHPVGDPLFVEWHGSWWKAKTVATLPDDRLVITYDGWSDDYDEVVKRPRVRTVVIGAPVYKAGESIFVEWKGSWWPARIVSVKGASYAIHYDGYGNEWDESVGSARMTRLTAPES